MRSRSARMASLLGVCENFTYTRVPPRKSTPSGMPCQNSIENTPATLNTSEKARKYHFLPRKSMLVLVNSCTASPLNAQRLATLVAVENAIEDDARDEHRRKQVGQKTKAQCHGEP